MTTKQRPAIATACYLLSGRERSTEANRSSIYSGSDNPWCLCMTSRHSSGARHQKISVVL